MVQKFFFFFRLLYLIEIAGATPKCHFFSKIFFVPILYWPIWWENLFAGVPAWKSCFLNNPTGQSLISRTVTDQPSLQLEPSGSLVSLVGLVGQFQSVTWFSQCDTIVWVVGKLKMEGKLSCFQHLAGCAFVMLKGWGAWAVILKICHPLRSLRDTPLRCAT